MGDYRTLQIMCRRKEVLFNADCNLQAGQGFQKRRRSSKMVMLPLQFYTCMNSTAIKKMSRCLNHLFSVWLFDIAILHYKRCNLSIFSRRGNKSRELRTVGPLSAVKSLQVTDCTHDAVKQNYGLQGRPPKMEEKA